jgi:hypothetical protein
MQVKWMSITLPELKIGITVLATRQAFPTVQDARTLLHMAKFVNFSGSTPIVITPSNMQVKGASDASFGRHKDGKSHSGYVIWFGGDQRSRSRSE